MKTICKYELKIQDQQFVKITGFIDYLKVAEENGKLFLWVLANTDETYIYTSNVYIVGTDNRISKDDESYTMIHKGTYFDSVLMSNGPVWHLFIR